uniref:Uncharacterized protein n=1 Tax=Anguilla anguilla TaxID=7936 RepID=A0A0E9WVM7_ANGAN
MHGPRELQAPSEVRWHAPWNFFLKNSCEKIISGEFFLGKIRQATDQ